MAVDGDERQPLTTALPGLLAAGDPTRGNGAREQALDLRAVPAAGWMALQPAQVVRVVTHQVTERPAGVASVGEHRAA